MPVVNSSEETDIAEDTSPSDNDGIIFPKKYEKETGNITFNTKVELNKDFNPNEIYAYTATQQHPDPSNTLNILFSGIDYQEEITTNDSGQTDYYYAGQNGETLLIYHNSVQLYKSFADHLPRVFNLSRVKYMALLGETDQVKRYCSNASADF